MVSHLNIWPVFSGGRWLLQQITFCCAVAGGAQFSLAGPPTPYGESFVRVGQAWPEAGAIVPPPEPIAVAETQDSASFQRRLSQLEDEGGPYANTLAEPLADIARFYRRGGDIEQAQQAYQRALHVVRINEGLYSERQVPILKELFETYRMTGDMATLDARYDYFFRLYGSGQPPFTPVRIGAALEYLRWQREALRLGLDQRDTERLLALYALNEQMLAAVAADTGEGFANYQALVLSQLRNLYLLLDRYEPRVEVIGPSASAGMPGGWDEQDAKQQRLEGLQRNALVHGRALLAELIKRTPPEQLDVLAGGWLELGDWNQWNDRRTEALEAYKNVASLLQDGGRDELLQQWLGLPVELPANGVFWQPRPITEGRAPIVVQARYDVSATGKAGNIEVTALDSDYASKTGKLRRNLAQTRFRPRMLSGEPVAEMQLQRDYEVLN